MSIFFDSRKISCQKLKQNKPNYNRELIERHKSIRKILPFPQVTPQMRRSVKQKTNVVNFLLSISILKLYNR